MALIDIDKYSKLVITANNTLEFKAPVDGSFNMEIISVRVYKRVDVFANDGTTKIKSFGNSTKKEEWLFEYRNAAWSSKKLTTNTPTKKGSAFYKNDSSFLTEGETYDASLDRSDDNMFLGENSGIANTTGEDNLFLGNSAGRRNTSGYYNTFIGKSAGFSNTSGNQNTFIGRGAGSSNQRGSYNTFIGDDAGQDNSGNYNTFIGSEAGYENGSGDSNTFIGDNAGYDNTIGDSNTFIGRNAGGNNTSGESNTFIGSGAGSKNKTGTGNIGIGGSPRYTSSDYEINIGNRIRWIGTDLQINRKSYSDGQPNVNTPNWMPFPGTQEVIWSGSQTSGNQDLISNKYFDDYSSILFIATRNNIAYSTETIGDLFDSTTELVQINGDGADRIRVQWVDNESFNVRDATNLTLVRIIGKI